VNYFVENNHPFEYITTSHKSCLCGADQMPCNRVNTNSRNFRESNRGRATGVWDETRSGTRFGSSSTSPSNAQPQLDLWTASRGEPWPVARDGRVADCEDGNGSRGSTVAAPVKAVQDGLLRLQQMISQIKHLICISSTNEENVIPCERMSGPAGSQRWLTGIMSRHPVRSP